MFKVPTLLSGKNKLNRILLVNSIKFRIKTISTIYLHLSVPIKSFIKFNNKTKIKLDAKLNIIYKIFNCACAVRKFYILFVYVVQVYLRVVKIQDAQ